MRTIQIIHNPEVKLKIPEFVCDKVLKKDVPKPYHLLVDGFKFILFVGRPQSGKTSHMMALFKDKKCLKKTFNNIILIMPQQSLNSLKEGSNIFKDIDPSKIFDDIEEIDVVREMVKMYANEGETSCIIIDDMMSKLKNPFVEKVLTDIVANRRHYKCSIMCLTQIIERVPLKIRKLVNTVIIQHKPSKREMEMAFEEWLEETPETALVVTKLAFQKQYDWLLIDVPTQKLYRKYDELVITEDLLEKDPSKN